MPRRYYRRTRVVRPKKKWASNIVFRSFEIIPGGTGIQPQPLTILVSNASQATTPTPTIIKAGNFKINADINHTTNGGSTNLHLIAVVAFLPEGIEPATNAAFGNLLVAHPEYIMGWKQLDSAYTTTSTITSDESVVFSSRLKRNLNSGDKIVFGILDQTENTPITSIRVGLTAQFWTCAN